MQNPESATRFIFFPRWLRLTTSSRALSWTWRRTRTWGWTSKTTWMSPSSSPGTYHFWCLSSHFIFLQQISISICDEILGGSWAGLPFLRCLLAFLSGGYIAIYRPWAFETFMGIIDRDIQTYMDRHIMFFQQIFSGACICAWFSGIIAFTTS